jgi:hypothetical protein
MRAELPNDMPQGAKFVATGMNASTHNRTGEWVACHEDHDQGTDRCRVTDQSGVVLYDGDFLPAGRRARAVPDDQLQIGAFNPHKGWVASAEDNSPAPTIPLQNGALLVPAGQSNLPQSHWTEDSGEVTPASASTR